MIAVQVFVSHSHQDADFCHEFVSMLRKAGADTWFDEEDLASGQLMDTIQEELDKRPVFIPILSKAAFASKWVKRETKWAYELADRDPTRIILPVTAGPIERGDFSGKNGWLFLSDFRRIERAPSFSAPAAPTPPGDRPATAADSAFHPLDAISAASKVLSSLGLTDAARSLALNETDSGAKTAPMVSGAFGTERTFDLLIMAKSLQIQGDFEGALALLKQLTAITPSSFAGWFNRGVALTELKRRNEALDALEHAIPLAPNNVLAWARRGAVLADLKRFEEARVSLEKARTLDPKRAATWFSLGRTYLAMQRYTDAFKAFDETTKLEPKNVAAWVELGATLHVQRRDKDALQSLDRAVALAPDNALAWARRGVVLADLKRPDDAIAAVERAVQLDPQNALVWECKGSVLKHCERTKEAIIAFERALALDQNVASAWREEGDVLAQVGRHEEALMYLERAAILDPSNAGIWRSKGQSLEALRRSEEAQAAFKRCRELNR